MKNLLGSLSIVMIITACGQSNESIQTSKLQSSSASSQLFFDCNNLYIRSLKKGWFSGKYYLDGSARLPGFSESLLTPRNAKFSADTKVEKVTKTDNSFEIIFSENSFLVHAGILLPNEDYAIRKLVIDTNKNVATLTWLQTTFKVSDGRNHPNENTLTMTEFVNCSAAPQFLEILESGI